MPSEVSFPHMLKTYRRASSLSQTELAHVLGIPVTQVINQYEAGTRRFPIEKLVVFAKATGCQPRTLIRAWLDDYAPDVATVIFSPSSATT